MRQIKHASVSRALPALAASLIAVAAIQTAAALTKVDILVAYDTTASAWLAANSKTGADFADAQVEKMNTVLKNSGLDTTFAFRCVGTHDGSFSFSSADTFDNLLDNAVGGTADAWKALRDARDSAGADIVMILVDPGTTSGHVGHSKSLVPIVSKDGGAAERVWDVTFDGADEYFKWFAEQAYGVCNIAVVAAEGDYTMAHEAGHIMGAGHSEKLNPSYSEPGPQLFKYSAAMMNNGYATVMGYNSDGYGNSYEVLPYFSSPDLKNPNTNEALGDADHDNVKTLKNTYEIVAAFRATKVADDSEQQQTQEGSEQSQSQTLEPTTHTVAPSGTFAQKTMISGVVKDGNAIAGVIHLTVAKTSKGYSKVSGSVIGLDGKKRAVKAGKYPVEGGSVAKVSVKAIVKDFDGELSVVLGEDYSISNGKLGNLTVTSASIGVLASGAPVFTIDEALSGFDFISELKYQDQEYFPLPYAGHGVAINATGDKWSTVAKAGKLKLKKNKETQTQELIPDIGKDGTKTNLSGLKISFAKKTATFKGSFSAYAIVNAKLKKFKFAVTGVVADGEGVGTAFCKNLGLTVPISVK